MISLTNRCYGWIGMLNLKHVFVLVAALALIVPTYFLLRVGPDIHSVCYARINCSVSSKVMASSINHVEGRHHNSELHGYNISITNTSSMGEDFGNRIDTKEMLPITPQHGHCSYKVQVYDKKDQLGKQSPIIQSVVTQSKKGSRVIQTDIQCNSNCSIELTIADDSNKFAGMDAVVFHFMKGLIPWPQPSARMNPNQTWVYFTWESPLSTAQESIRVGGLPVHATWSYHRVSDITTPYGFYRPGIPMVNQTKSVAEWLKGKTKLVAWMASNCKDTFWPRTTFVRELNKYVKVDSYGACGNLKCMPAYSRKCTVDLMRQYKFYLSLENAECEDYITEKLWNKPLMQGVIPIVYGPRRKIYEELLPPNSFIYIGDYKNMKELADYLKLLDSKPELYAQYLEWQYKGSVGVPKQMHESYQPSIFCNLIPVIEKVKRGELKRRPVGDSTFSNSCRKPLIDPVRSEYASGLGKWNPW